MSFKDGLLMHIMNPKATLATLPIATIHFPANDITGIQILITSLLLAVLACFAPWSYSVIGQTFGSKISSGKVLRVFNVLMALLLAYVAFSILWEHVYLVLMGVKAY